MGAEAEIRGFLEKLTGEGGKTQKQIGEMCGVDQSQISRFMSGKSVQLGTLGRILDGLRLKIVPPGQGPGYGPLSPEAVRVNEAILAMRKAGMDPEAIRDGAVRELSKQFEKNAKDAGVGKENRKAS